MPPKKKGSHKKTPPPKKGSTSETTQPDYPKEENIEKGNENVCELSQEEQIDEKGGKRKNDEASQGKIDKISWEPKMLKLSCGHPTSTTKVEFDITQESNVNKSFYEIRSSLSMTPYTVKKFNERNFFLNFEPFDSTLDKWLCGQTDLWCPIYRQWGEYHPNDDLRRVLRGMILSVCFLHERGEFHGSLDCVKNYGLRFVRNYEGEEETGTVEVILLYRSSKSNTTIKSSEFDGSIVDEGIKQDMADLCTVIFDKILKIENVEVAEDLKHLHVLMANNSCIKTISVERGFIASHRSLWHWRSKLHFFGKVCNEYIQGQCRHKGMLNSVSITIHAAIQLVSCATDWQTRIPANTPFEKLIKHPNASVYHNWPIDLLHFVRDFLGHINDNDEFGKKMYIDEAMEGYYSNKQYVEKMIGDIFPLFLVEFYKELSELNFFVW